MGARQNAAAQANQAPQGEQVQPTPQAPQVAILGLVPVVQGAIHRSSAWNVDVTKASSTKYMDMCLWC